MLASIEPRCPQLPADFQFVLHRVAGERGVVRLEVQLQMRQQIVLAQEIEAGRGVGIVLVLGRLLRLRLDVELALEADLFGVVDGHVEELGEMIELALHVGVPQILVAFAAAPEHVAVAAEFLGHFERLLHLGGGVGKGLGVAARGRAVHVARIAEEIGRAPEQLDAGPLLLFFEHLDDGVEILVRLGEVRAFGRDVAIVERIERRAELLDELERDAGAVLGVLDRVAAVVPRPDGGAGAERIGERIRGTCASRRR